MVLIFFLDYEVKGKEMVSNIQFYNSAPEIIKPIFVILTACALVSL